MGSSALRSPACMPRPPADSPRAISESLPGIAVTADLRLGSDFSGNGSGAYGREALGEIGVVLFIKVEPHP
jgi:hypothetical protein